MSSRDVTIAGFLLLAVAAAALVVSSRLRPDSLPRFGTVVQAVMTRHIVLRATVVFVWAWLGWHFLARTGG